MLFPSVRHRTSYRKTSDGPTSDFLVQVHQQKTRTGRLKPAPQNRLQKGCVRRQPEDLNNRSFTRSLLIAESDREAPGQ